VVAAEVRSLAQRCAQAAKDINNLTTHSSGRVPEGVDLVNRADGSLGEIVDSSKRVAAIVAEIVTSSIWLSALLICSQRNSALVEQNAATARTLENQSGAVSERLSAFRFGDDGAGVRAAA
jgi:methyl-accepting chemotaxis protein